MWHHIMYIQYVYIYLGVNNKMLTKLVKRKKKDVFIKIG